MVSVPPYPSDYQAALSGAVYRVQDQAGYLRLGDSGRIDFLQRQTTNDLGLLKPDRAVTTVLTSPTARILDVLTLIDEGEFLDALTLPGQGAATLAFLKGRIFFMDRVSLEDASDACLQVDLDGPQAGEVLGRIGLEKPAGVGLLSRRNLNGTWLRVIGRQGLTGEGYRILAPAESGKWLLAQLQANGGLELSRNGFEALRVEAGIPAAGHELTQEATPLEVGLTWAVSSEKGCYTGQEIIARQITYDKVTRHLVGLQLDAPAEEGAPVHKGERAVGTVTSAVVSPRFGPIALAILRRPHHAPATTVTVPAGSRGIAAQTVALPFQP